MNKHILVLDDDPDIRSEMVEALNAGGFDATGVGTIEEFWSAVDRTGARVHLVDLKLGGRDGLDVVRTLRTRPADGIIIVSGLNDEIDKVLGLELGADDYITKPFSPRELLARVRSVARRVQQHESDRITGPDSRVVEIDGWRINPFARSVLDGFGDAVPVSDAEFDLLLVFVRSPDRILARAELYRRSRGREWVAEDRTVDVLISRLRRTLALRNAPFRINTIRNRGYMLTLAA